MLSCTPSMADSSPPPPEEDKHRSLGHGSGTWLDKYARNIQLPGSIQREIAHTGLKDRVTGRNLSEPDAAARREEMKKWGYTGAALVLLGSLGMGVGMYLRATAPARRVTMTAQEAIRMMELQRQGVVAPTAAQIKGKEAELAALEARWRQLKTRHFERHTLLYRDD
jgi:hypothetical protein